MGRGRSRSVRGPGGRSGRAAVGRWVWRGDDGAAVSLVAEIAPDRRRALALALTQLALALGLALGLLALAERPRWRWRQLALFAAAVNASLAFGGATVGKRTNWTNSPEWLSGALPESPVAARGARARAGVA